MVSSAALRASMALTRSSSTGMTDAWSASCTETWRWEERWEE